MERFTIRYLLASLALIGACLAIYMIPHTGDQFLALRLAGFIIGISTVVHLAVTMLRLKSWWKWLFASVAPTAGLVGWYVYGVEFGNQHPGSIGVYGFLTGGLFWFPIGYVIVNGLMLAINRIGTPKTPVDSIG